MPAVALTFKICEIIKTEPTLGKVYGKLVPVHESFFPSSGYLHILLDRAMKYIGVVDDATLEQVNWYPYDKNRRCTHDAFREEDKIVTHNSLREGLLFLASLDSSVHSNP